MASRQGLRPQALSQALAVFWDLWRVPPKDLNSGEAGLAPHQRNPLMRSPRPPHASAGGHGRAQAPCHLDKSAVTARFINRNRRANMKSVSNYTRTPTCTTLSQYTRIHEYTR